MNSHQLVPDVLGVASSFCSGILIERTLLHLLCSSLPVQWLLRVVVTGGVDAMCETGWWCAGLRTARCSKRVPSMSCRWTRRRWPWRSRTRSWTMPGRTKWRRPTSWAASTPSVQSTFKVCILDLLLVLLLLLLAICRPSDCIVVSGIVGVVVGGVSNRSQMRTSKCTCLIFGVSIGLNRG